MPPIFALRMKLILSSLINISDDATFGLLFGVVDCLQPDSHGSICRLAGQSVSTSRC